MENKNLPKQSSDQTPPLQQPNADFTLPISSPKVNPTPNSKINLLLIVAIVVINGLIQGSIYYFKEKETFDSPLKKQQSQEQSEAKSETPLFSGQLERLSQDLQIFKSSETDTLNAICKTCVYYVAGKFNRGELKDYTRIIAINPSVSQGSPTIVILATRDFQSYILDVPDNKTSISPVDYLKERYSILDKSKVISTKTFETEQPLEIDLDKNFSLYFEEFPIEYVQTGRKDDDGNQIYDFQLTSNFSSFQKLTSPLKNLEIYLKPYEQSSTNYDHLEQSRKELFQEMKNYTLGYTQVIVVDSAGLPIAYSMTTPGNIEKKLQGEIAYKAYEEQWEKYQNKEIDQAPQRPNSDDWFYPSLGFSNSQINSQNNFKFFTNYQAAFPTFCATSQNSLVMKLSDSDLEPIGSVSSFPLFRLKDTNHPLYALAYKHKVQYNDEIPVSSSLDNKEYSQWEDYNEGMQKPTLEEYVSKNPLLFIKDYWQQWVVLGESDISLIQECGKPVIYLYPTQPTEVSVRFEVPIKFTTDIPKYADFWLVKAYPNGSLVNLKPEFTNCQQIDIQRKGAEYAQQACQTNTYPYLYWAGNVISRNYPEIKGGWVVDQKKLGGFLSEKLIEMGLNDVEIDDFTGYWLPDMLEKNAPYYRISFLQTNDLNLLFPMTVTPKPDTTFRIFLDYSPLTEEPEQLPQPQILNKLVRKGFTLVEWGGLKQPR